MGEQGDKKAPQPQAEEPKGKEIPKEVKLPEPVKEWRGYVPIGKAHDRKDERG